MSDTVIVHGSDDSDSPDPVADLRARIEQLETRVQHLDDTKAEIGHSHDELATAIEAKAPAEHEHDAYVTHEELSHVEDEIDNIILDLNDDLDDAAGLDELPMEGTTIAPGPEAGEESRHKPGMLI